MPRNTLEYSSPQDESQYDPRDFQDRNLDPRVDNRTLLDAFRDSSVEPWHNRPTGYDNHTRSYYIIGDASQQEDVRNNPTGARAMEFTSDLSLPHRELIGMLRDTAWDMSPAGRSNHLDEKLAAETGLAEYVTKHPDWVERWQAADDAAQMMMDVGERLTTLGFIREDEKLVQAGRTAMQHGSNIVLDFQTDDKMSSTLTEIDRGYSWENPLQDHQETMKAVQNMIEWVITQGEVPEEYRKDIQETLANRLCERIQLNLEETEQALLWRAQDSSSMTAKVLRENTRQFFEHPGDEGFLKFQEALALDDLRTGAQTLEAMREHLETIVGVPFTIIERSKQPGETGWRHRDDQQPLDVAETQEFLEKVMDAIPDEDEIVTVADSIQEQVRTICWANARYALDRIKKMEEEGDDREDSLRSLIEYEMWLVDETRELTHQGAVAECVQAARASSNWEPFLRQEIRLDG